MASDLIERQDVEGFTILRLSRPEKRNAINNKLRAALIDALEQIQSDRSVRALVLTGVGQAFCASGDVASMQKRFDAPAGDIAFNGWSRQQRVHYAQSFLHTLPIPSIAAVNGRAAGLGAGMALACDFVIASSESTFAWSYMHLAAGNASPVNDGACALLLADEESAAEHGLTPGVSVLGMATAGFAPRLVGTDPAPATRKVLALTGLTLAELDVIELNEACAAQGLAVSRDLSLADDDPRVNPNGGAIALGHPLGASGARLVTTALNQLERNALCTTCIGVGQGVAAVLERV